MGLAIAISRSSPAPIVGHIGWAIQMADGTFFAGATEAFHSVEHPETIGSIKPGDNIDAWAIPFRTKEEMLAAFAGSAPNGHAPYTWWMAYNVANPNYEAARKQGEANARRGYWLPGNNCLDHATDVLAAYGVPWQGPGHPANAMPWKQTNPTPVGWLNAWQQANPGALHSFNKTLGIREHLTQIQHEHDAISTKLSARRLSGT